MSEATIVIAWAALFVGILLGWFVEWADNRQKKPKRYCEDCMYVHPDSYGPFSLCLAQIKTRYGMGYVTRSTVENPRCTSINENGRCLYWEAKQPEDTK